MPRHIIIVLEFDSLLLLIVAILRSASTLRFTIATSSITVGLLFTRTFYVYFSSVLPKIQANAAGAADALMLDMDGFVAETNATNVFLVKRGVVYTPLPDACLPGITRDKVMQLLRSQTDISCVECRLSLSEFHAADEVFTTGTMGEITPVREIDGRIIGSGVRGPVTEFVQELYRRFTETSGVPIPF